MCRMLAIVSKKAVNLETMVRFRRLAVEGKTANGAPDRRGHRDGWGVAAFSEEDVIWNRSAGAADVDPEYERTARRISRLLHIR